MKNIVLFMEKWHLIYSKFRDDIKYYLMDNYFAQFKL